MENRGFTIIELLSVLILLSLLSSIVVFSTMSVIKSSKEELTNKQIKNIEEAAKAYYLKEGIKQEVYNIDNTNSCVNLSYLIAKGYINDDKITLLFNNDEISGSVNIIYKSNQYTYQYSDDVCKDQFSNVVKKILNDNKVKKEIDGMFNYTNEGKNTSNGEVNNNYITNGLYSMEDEDGISYYFRGTVDNLIQFGENKNGNLLYWKIVRINGDNSLRLLYSGTSVDATLSELTIGSSKYNKDEYDSPKYLGYTYDNNIDSSIKGEIDKWYNDTFLNSKYDNYILMGRFCNDTSGYTISGTESEYNGNFSVTNRLLNKEVKPILKCPQTKENYGGVYNLKAGLITADEMVLGGNKKSVIANNYLTLSVSDYVTMSPVRFDYYPGAVEGSVIWSYSSTNGFTDSYAITNLFGIRPVINVDTKNLKLTGSGSESNPYILSIIEN